MPYKTGDQEKRTRVPGIRQAGPSRFLVSARWTDPRTGRRKKRTGISSTLAEAVALQEELRGSEPATNAAPSRLRFEDYAKRWLGARANLAPSTERFYADALAHATVGFGSIYVDVLRPADIREWLTARATRYAAATRNGWLRVVRQSLDDAVADGLLAGNPARSVKAAHEGRTKGPRGTSLALDEFRRFLAGVERAVAEEVVPADTGRLLLAAAWTGCRKGELVALRFSDVVDGELRVERAVWHRLERATKTDDPRRVAIVEPLARVIDEQRRWLLESQHPGLASGLIFPASPNHAKGGATRRATGDAPAEVTWYRSDLRRPLLRVVELASLPKVSPHSFRRTFENLLRRAGVDQLVRRATAGWRTEEAQAIYAQVTPEERKGAARALLQLVEGAA